MAAPATHAVVSLPALDLRPRPDHRAELGSQLLLGETVRLLDARPRAGWRHVRNAADGYEGWVRDWGLVSAAGARVRRWERAARARVVAPWALVTARPDAGVAVGPLFFASRVIAGRARLGRREVELPDGRRGWVAAAALAGVADPPPSIVERVGSLLGTPYLWGGRTSAGLDCSAFVQLVLAEQGVAMPRDASDQYVACEPLRAAETALEGDLAFFAAPRRPAGHVGLALGDGYFVHSRGTVRIASVNPDNALCDKDLLPQLLGWYRPRKGRRRAAR